MRNTGTAYNVEVTDTHPYTSDPGSITWVIITGVGHESINLSEDEFLAITRKGQELLEEFHQEPLFSEEQIRWLRANAKTGTSHSLAIRAAAVRVCK